MSAADAVAAVVMGAVVLYSVFGGADFGSGVWDLTAGRTVGGAPLRRLVDHAIGPVWEANHVWLIFVLVVLWSGFPRPFTDLVASTAVPWWLAAVGIVARGAAFAFRKFSPSLAWARRAGVVFAGASLITPFFLGTIAGAVASGRVPGHQRAVDRVGPFASWLGPTSLLGGVLAVATCTFLAGVLLTAAASNQGQPAVAEELRTKSMIGGAITGTIALVGIPVILTDAPTLADGLLGRGLPLVVGSALGGLGTMWLLRQRRYGAARFTAGGAVASVVAGWGVAQYPWLLVDETTIAEGAGARATLVGLLVAAGIGAILVVLSLLYLFRLADTSVGPAGTDGVNRSGPAPSGDLGRSPRRR